MAPTIASPRLTLYPEPLTPSSFSAFGTVITSPLPASRTRLPYPPPQSSHPANQNTALKYPDIAPLTSTYRLSPSGTPASPHMSLFACFPRQLRRPSSSSSSSSSPSSSSPSSKPSPTHHLFDVKNLERHPYTTQTFHPLTPASGTRNTRYLVIVAPTLPPPPPTAGLTPYSPQQTPHHHLTGGGMPDPRNTKAFLAEPGVGVTYGVGVWHAPMAVVGEGRVDFVVSQWMSGREGEDCQEVDLAGLDGTGIEVVVEGGVGGGAGGRAKL